MHVVIFFVLVGIVNFVAGFVLAMTFGLGPTNWDEVRRFFARSAD
ncbi:MAG: hypothetical protein ACUVQG_08080 [Thermogutta sp.]